MHHEWKISIRAGQTLIKNQGAHGADALQSAPQSSTGEPGAAAAAP